MHYLKNSVIRGTGYIPSQQYKYSVLLVVLIVLVGLLSVPGRLVGGSEVVLAASDPVIAAAGDIACDPASPNFNGGIGTSTHCRQKYTSDLLVDAGLAGVLMLGDGQYECGSLQAFMQSYDSSWGRVKSITYPVIGNHEYQTTGGVDCTTDNAGAAGYFDYFGAAAGTRGQGYYSFDIGEWHIIVLNSNCAEVGGCDTSSPQGQWLQADLASHTNMCTLASFHHPLFSSGTHTSSNSLPFWQLLYQYNAELILTGHEHLYERFAPQSPSGAADPVNGIRQFIIGTGGEEFHTISQVALNSEARNDNTFGVLKLALHPNSYDWEFVSEAGGTFTDSGNSPCHNPTPPPSGNPLYASFASNGSIGGVSFADEDIMKFNGSVWTKYFDGSDVGVGGSDLFGFSIVDSDTLLMSFSTALTLNGLSVTPQDVVQFDATSLGLVTAGTFSMYLNGIDVGLDTTAESIDSVSLLSDGRVLISTTGSSTVPGVAGLDEDILALTPAALGDITSGTWAMYFDGSDVGLDASAEDVDALDVDPNGNIYLSAMGDFAVSGVSGFDEDVFVCSPTSLGDVTACNYFTELYFDGSVWGQDANDVDAINLLISGPFPTATPSNTPVPTNTPTPTNTPAATFTATIAATSTALPSTTPLYASFESNGSVGGVVFADEDIMKFDGSAWTQYFDGSDVGVGGSDLLGFSIVDSDTLLMSFTTSLTLNDISMTPQDVVQFDATSLGSVTAGTFSMYLNGVDIGLDATTESIDSVSLLPNGQVLISTTGGSSVPGVVGEDEDVLEFTPTALGNLTSGTWAMYFDGSDVGLDVSTEDVDALEVDPNGNIYLSTMGDFAVSGVSGFDEDIFVCAPTSIGSVTACNYSSALFFDGSAWGLGTNDIDGFNLLLTDSFPTATPSNTSVPTNTPTATFTATSTPTATVTATVGSSPTPTNTPTHTSTPLPTNTPTITLTPIDTPTFTATPIASNTPIVIPTFTATPLPDLIFADDFESGGLSAWSSASTGAGDLSVTTSAALIGSNGMQAVINDITAMYTVDNTPNAEPHYRARFYFDPNSISMLDGNAHYIFVGYDANAVFNIDFRFSGGSYQIRLRQQNDSLAATSTAWVTISDAPHFIEMEWWAATAAGANNGGVMLWIDGVQVGSLNDLDNDTRRIEQVRFGAVSQIDAGTLGAYYLDAFESRRQTYIGP